MYSEKMLLKEITKTNKGINKYRLISFSFIVLDSLLSGASTFFVPAITENFRTGRTTFAVVIIFCMLWQRVMFEIFGKYQNKAVENLSIEVNKHTDELTHRIAKKVEGKVYHNDDGIERRLSSFEIRENLREYMIQSYSFKDEVIKNIIYILTFVVTICGSIYTTLKMTNDGTTFICLMTICAIVISIVSYNNIKLRKKYSKKKRKLTDKLRDSDHDCASIYAQNEKHNDFLFNVYHDISFKTSVEKREMGLKESNSYILRSFIMTMALSIMVVVSLIREPKLTFDVGVSIVALTNMYEKIIFSISNQVRRLQKLAENYSEKDSHTEIVELIATKYLEIVGLEKKLDEKIPIHKFLLKNFSYDYMDNEENVIHTVKANNLLFEEGTTTLIYGGSGYGKSTLIKALTGVLVHENMILVNDCIYLNYLHNYLMYMDDSSKIGSNLLLNEIITESSYDKLDEERLIEILKGIRLYDSIKDKVKHSGKSVVDFLRESYKYKSSTGEDKRYSLARTLYNLTKEDDILILDEPIGNIDEENAIKVIEFINDFANRDRKRIIIIISHQVSITRKFCSQVIRIEKSPEDERRIFRFVKEQ